MSIPGGSGEVSVHQMASHFPSLPTIAWLRSLQAVRAARSAMKRTSSDERDYGFGQVMLTRPAWPRGTASHAKCQGSGRPGAVLPGEK